VNFVAITLCLASQQVFLVVVVVYFVIDSVGKLVDPPSYVMTCNGPPPLFLSNALVLFASLLL
jgi:hypothetical protein